MCAVIIVGGRRFQVSVLHERMFLEAGTETEKREEVG